VVAEATGCTDDDYFEEVYHVPDLGWMHSYSLQLMLSVRELCD
jgi:hypothetical protein